MDYFKEDARDAGERIGKELRAIDGLLADLETKKQRVIDIYLSGDLSREGYAAKNHELGGIAATDSSYHGGSRRGGFGHGLAADLVRVKGEIRSERGRRASDETVRTDFFRQLASGLDRLLRDQSICRT